MDPYSQRLLRSPLLLCALSGLGLGVRAQAQPPHGLAPTSLPPTSTLVVSVALVILLILLMGTFAMAEAALLALRPTRVEQLVEEGRRAARTIQRLTQNPDRMIATTQVGVTLCGFVAAAVAATVLSQPLLPWLQRLSGGNYLTSLVASALITIPVAIIAMVVGGLLPKSLALQAPDHWAMRLAPLVAFSTILFAPFSVLILGLSRLFVPHARFQAPMMTRDEFQKFVDDQGEGGGIDEDEEEIIKNVIELSETEVRSVMTPRVDMAALPANAPLERALEIILSSGHSRIPVYENTIDNVIGILHAKDLLRLFQGTSRTIDLTQVARTPFFVTESRRVADLLEVMRESNYQLAIVQDEYAGTAGLVTIEDLVEEIVGEIKDEYDIDEPEAQVISATETLLDSRLSLDAVNERLGTLIEHEDYTTIGGYIFGQLGHEPKVGETVEVANVTFAVETVAGRRIRTIRAIRQPEQAEHNDER